jgi:hypothetical protein
MTRWSASLRVQQDLAICGVVALAAALAVVLDLPAAIRLPLAVPLAVFVPGYGMLHALLPGATLASAERLIIAIGTSIGVTILGGIVLALSPARLSPVSWAVMLAAVSLTALGVAWLRRTREGISGPRLARPRVPLGGAVVILVSAVLLADVVLGARFIAAEQLAPAPEQLWMLPNDSSSDVRLGMQAGPGGGEYVVRVSSGGDTVAQYELRLGQGETWQTELPVTVEQRSAPLVARLYEGGSETEPRFVVLQPATTGD